jgi:hypothetical protein
LREVRVGAADEAAPVGVARKDQAVVAQQEEPVARREVDALVEPLELAQIDQRSDVCLESPVRGSQLARHEHRGLRVDGSERTGRPAQHAGWQRVRPVEQDAPCIADEHRVERQARLDEGEGQAPLLGVGLPSGALVPGRERVKRDFAALERVGRVLRQRLRKIGELAIVVDQRLLVRAPDVDGRGDGESEDQRDADDDDATPQAQPSGPADAHADADDLRVPAGSRGEVPAGLRSYYGWNRGARDGVSALANASAISRLTSGLRRISPTPATWASAVR